MYICEPMMSEDLPTTRRNLLKIGGAATAVAVAGCSTAPSNQGAAETPTETNAPQTEQQSLDAAKDTDLDRVAADPTDVPDPIDRDESTTVEVDFTTTEVVAEVESGVTYKYMTFEDQIPGPMIRVRRGDRVHVTLESDPNNSMPHNIDLHAVYGPGGGAEDSTVAPGETAQFEFTAMYPGVHVYHCAVPNMDQHISAGMFGAILVEPEDGLPEVDRELYFGQHELYTNGELGQEGHHTHDFDATKNEDPTYVPINGEPWAFTDNGYGPISVEKGERVRIFWANGGPNMISSWHGIGNVWETFYRDGAVASEPDHYVETAPVVPGSVAIAEIDTPVPGPVKLVDHALSRATRRGTLGVISVEGEEEPDIYDGDP
jgi:nitrite reductase (NO-forming)